MKRIAALIAALATCLGILTATPASADTPCVKVWLTAPSYFGHYESGTRRCVWPNDRVNGWTRIYADNNRTHPVVDYAHTYTRVPPNSGRVRSTSSAAHALANRHNVRLQFANRDLIGRLGCSGAFRHSVSGAYQGSAQYPGKGLVRIGTGTTTRCMADRSNVLDVVRHEIAHAAIERKCGTTRPRIAGSRVEPVTIAYSYLYLGARTNTGDMKPTVTDHRRATHIKNGRCS